MKIKDAAITVSAGGDGIRSTNTEKSNKGFVYIETGNIDITSGNDGIQAATVLKAANGSIKITAGGGAADTKQNSGGEICRASAAAPKRLMIRKAQRA